MSSNKKGLKDSTNRLLGIHESFVSLSFGTKRKILLCGGFDSDCTVVTLHRTASFRVKHLDSEIEQTRR